MSLAVDVDAVRRRIGAWVATQPAGERPAHDLLWRDALLVVDQVLALARATLGAGGAPLWTVDVRLPSAAHVLATLSGVAARSLHRATDALIAAEALDGVSQVGSERVVRLRPEVLTDAPVLAAVRWDIVRGRLGDADAPAARLIVRELACRTTSEARAQAHFVSASQRELAEAVGYSKGSMRRHLDALVSAGLIVSRSRDRANSWHRLQPIVFEGEAVVERPAPPSDEALSRPVPRRILGGSAPAPSPSLPAALPTRTSSPVPRAPTAPVDAALTLEVNGVRVALPAGVELTLEQDDGGAMWYRAGTLRLGPVRFD